MPRLSGSQTWRILADLHGRPAEALAENPIDLKRAEFHPRGETRVDQAELLAWRDEMNAWAWDRGFPNRWNTEARIRWDVELGQRLNEDFSAIPEVMHLDVWSWMATFLLPHFVVYRWDWPGLKDGQVPTGRAQWARFGSDQRNALRLALYRIQTFGPETTAAAIEQEFQSIQYRAAYGSDPRVGRLILETFVRAASDDSSNYGRNGGSRALDCNEACIELRLINSLQPLCFAPDDEVIATVEDVIFRLPELRRERGNAQG